MPLVNGFTQSVTVTNTAALASAITVQSNCKQIEVGEDSGVNGFPTGDFYVYKPSSGSTPRRVQAGGRYSIAGNFTPGQVVMFVGTVAGTTTFFQDET